MSVFKSTRSTAIGLRPGLILGLDCFAGSESRQDFRRLEDLPKLLTSFATLKLNLDKTLISILIFFLAHPLQAVLQGQTTKPIQIVLQRVDFNPDNGRSDVLTPLAFNWPIKESSEEKSSIGSLQVQLKATGSSSPKLTFGWWKAGYVSGATFCSDGVTTVNAGDSIEMTLRGLPEGKHSFASWHNVWEESPATDPLEVDAFVRTDDSPLKFIQNFVVHPTHRVMHDDDAETLYLEFTVKAGQEILLRFRPTNSQQRVALNGFAWDVSNPTLQATKHLPKDQDEHVSVNPQLSWQAPRGIGSQLATTSTMKYQVYFGNSREKVSKATPEGTFYLGEMSDTQLDVIADDCLNDYYWRVDCRQADGTVTSGETRRFKVRQLAFPGAEGYGRFAIGGRGGRVLSVTHLDDSGPGSLREAIDAVGPRTIVFRTSGTIQLKSKLLIRNPYVTIAGQTAPGDGICVRGFTFGCFGTHDVIMRHLRIRVGDESGETMDGTGFASTDHSIFDHCSISWSIDEAVSSRGAKNITLQRCIVAEALNIANHKKYDAGKGHSFAGSISGNIGSFHHNLLAHCAGRNWSLAGGLDNAGHFAGKLDIRNNVVFNWEHRTNDGGAKATNLVNNLYIPGPATRVFHLLNPDVGSSADRQEYFVNGNAMEGHFGPEDNWRDAVLLAADLVEAARVNEPFFEACVTTHTVDQLLENVLSDVGANHAGHDAVDQRIVQNVRQRNSNYQGSRSGKPGIIDSQSDVGGWPELESTEAPKDSDLDGMPDEWETKNGLDPNQPDQNSRVIANYATALEAYLAELSNDATR